MHCVCRVFRQLAGEQAEAEEFPSTFLSSYALSTRLQSMHMQAGGSLPASLDAELAPGHLLAVCLEEQRLVQAPPASSSEIAGMNVTPTDHHSWGNTSLSTMCLHTCFAGYQIRVKFLQLANFVELDISASW